MLTYFNNVWAGSADPLWPHIILLAISIVAAFAVGIGIKLESPKYSEAAKRVATWLVLGGIGIESLCTVSLFVFDERISLAQQSKIIAMEARPWTKAQFDGIQEVKGKVTDVGVFPEKGCIECELFADHIELALNAASVRLHGDSSLDWGMIGTGIMVWLPEGSDLTNDPLVVGLRDAGLNPAAMHHVPKEWSAVRTDIPVIFVGEKFPLLGQFPYSPGKTAAWTILPLKNPYFNPSAVPKPQ